MRECRPPFSGWRGTGVAEPSTLHRCSYQYHPEGIRVTAEELSKQVTHRLDRLKSYADGRLTTSIQPYPLARHPIPSTKRRNSASFFSSESDMGSSSLLGKHHSIMPRDGPRAYRLEVSAPNLVDHHLFVLISEPSRPLMEAGVGTLGSVPLEDVDHLKG